MSYKYLLNLLYNCHNLPQTRKDFIAVRMSETMTRSDLPVWRQLLVNGLAVKEEFFKAYSPVQKSKILSGLCESIRRIKRAGCSRQLFEVLDHIYCLDRGEPSDGKAGAFFRMRLRQSPDKRVKAMLAAVIMELPEQHHRVEEVAAAIHGDYLLSIRAMERLCGFGEPGLKVLYQLLEEVYLTPAITFTLLKLIETTRCRDSLKRTMAAKVFLRANQDETGTTRPLVSPGSDSAIRMMRSAKVSRALQRAPASTKFYLNKGQRNRVGQDPVFQRFDATRKNPVRPQERCHVCAKNHKEPSLCRGFDATRKNPVRPQGGCHVCAKNHKDPSLCRGFATDHGDTGKERLRLSIQLKNYGLPTNL